MARAPEISSHSTGNAEPGIVRSPAADADQQIGAVLGAQLGVEVSDRLRDFLTAAALEAMGVHHHDVVQFSMRPLPSTFVLWQISCAGSTSPIAKSSPSRESTSGRICRNPKSAGSSACGQADRELDLHRTAQRIFADCAPANSRIVRQRKHALLQHGRETSPRGLRDG